MYMYGFVSVTAAHDFGAHCFVNHRSRVSSEGVGTVTVEGLHADIATGMRSDRWRHMSTVDQEYQAWVMRAVPGYHKATIDLVQILGSIRIRIRIRARTGTGTGLVWSHFQALHSGIAGPAIGLP